jgi:hypothetical protein
MARYYVNDRAQTNGDHEVHDESCRYLPSVEHRTYLGNYTNCRDAVREARRKYSQVNGCYYCSRECHTS